MSDEAEVKTPSARAYAVECHALETSGRFSVMQSATKVYLAIPDRRDAAAVRTALEGVMNGMLVCRALSLAADVRADLQSGTLAASDKSSLLRALMDDLGTEKPIWKSWDEQSTCFCFMERSTDEASIPYHSIRGGSRLHQGLIP